MNNNLDDFQKYYDKYIYIKIIYIYIYIYIYYIIYYKLLDNYEIYLPAPQDGRCVLSKFELK